MACSIENGVLTPESWHVVLDLAEGRFPAIHRTFFSRPCQHCRNAPCVEVCPTGASRKEEDGRELVRYDDCIGCRYCIVACPYEARVFNWRRPRKPPVEHAAVPARSRGVTEKCTFCSHRIEAARKEGRPVGSDAPDGVVPACVENCVGGALYFGDLDDPGSLVSRLVATRGHRRLLVEKGTDPSVIYLL
ncbi:MAG: 4Fe-4S dicluster domain-containing protein [Planctomycetota bacterium]